MFVCVLFYYLMIFMFSFLSSCFGHSLPDKADSLPSPVYISTTCVRSHDWPSKTSRLTLSFKYVPRHFTPCKKKLVLIWTWINQFLEEKLEPPNKGRLRCQHVSRWPIINIWCFPLIIGCSMSFPPLPRQRCVSFRMLSFMFMRSKEINLNTKFYMAWRQRLTPFAYNLNVSIGSLP